MLKNIFLFIFIPFQALAFSSSALAHCQIPCGIYDDEAKIKELHQHVSTIEKASLKIRELSTKKDALSTNQLVRWTLNKEHHADKIIQEVSNYFLAQRLKETGRKDKNYQVYLSSLTAYHSLIRSAMKAKQATSKESVQELHKSLISVESSYKKTLP